MQRQISQICFVVDQLDAAMQAWLSGGCVGPFYVFNHFQFQEIEMIKPVYSRDKADAIRLAIAQSGPIQIELIEPRPSSLPLYQRSGRLLADQVHHMATLTMDLQAEMDTLSALGYEPVFQARVTRAGRIAYMQSSQGQQPSLLELVQTDDELAGLFDMVRQASIDWDGHDPIRMMD